MPAISDEDFLRQYEACTWPEEQWHHREHIRLAYLYLCRMPFEEAVERMRMSLKAYNSAHKVPESLTRGYHETITVGWMRLVHLTLCEYGPEEDSHMFLRQHSQLCESKLLRLFYSRERLVTETAKAGFVEPDLAPLPRSKKSITRRLKPELR